MLISPQIIDRDKKNGQIAKQSALSKLNGSSLRIFADDITGTYARINQARISQYHSEKRSLMAISDNPFHAMTELKTVHRDGRVNHTLWYANENTSITQELDDVIIVPWTHPGFQIAITADLNQSHEVNDPRYNLIGVTPTGRARFQKVCPDIVGVYDPGGHVGNLEKIPAERGLKAVKLRMTQDQVNAFVSKMKGVLFVTGAPGSGKTTVAFQRMRFLFDRGDENTSVEHSPETSKVFLANENLINYSQELLEKQLDIPTSVISLIKEFIQDYLDDAWRFKNEALLLTQDTTNKIHLRAREAFLATCSVNDLSECWKTYERQILNRMRYLADSEWALSIFRESDKKSALTELIKKLQEFVKVQQRKQPSSYPLSSEVNMDRLYRYCVVQYEGLRTLLNRIEVDQFDNLFLKWLFFIYDPIVCLSQYFESRVHEGELRVRRGTGSKVDELLIIRQILEDWSRRRYHREEITWLAWLLRFALPTAEDPKDRFRMLPNAYSPVSQKYGQWSHVVIDEAQDLSVVEASLLASFVAQGGALTIAADFRQVVSPVHGMENPAAFKIGCSLIGQSENFKLYPFTKNMRQTGQIGNFLRGFYEQAFGELPPFIANDEMIGPKPQLHLMPYMNFAQTIRKVMNVFRQKQFMCSMALLQINEDEDEMVLYREMLEKEEVLLAPIWASEGPDGCLVTTSVERIKGLEFDMCLILGLEKVENNMLNFNRNRAYVALSRPTQRLYMFCEHIPSLLHGINNDLYDVFDVR